MNITPHQLAGLLFYHDYPGQGIEGYYFDASTKTKKYYLAKAKSLLKDLAEGNLGIRK